MKPNNIEIRIDIDSTIGKSLKRKIRQAIESKENLDFNSLTFKFSFYEKDLSFSC